MMKTIQDLKAKISLIFSIIISSCAPEIRRQVIPHFTFEHSIQTDINIPVDVSVDGGYIFVIDGINQIIKRFNGGEIQFGGFGTDKETFIRPASIDGTNGDIFVLDKSAREIKIFDVDGNYISSFSINEIESPSEIVLDGFGRLYILDRRNFKIYIYTEQGEYLNEFGAYGWGAGFLHSPVGIAYNNQYLYILDEKKISVFDTDGNYIREIPLKQKGREIAVNEYVYVLMDKGVYIFTDTGKGVGKITGKWDNIYTKNKRVYLTKANEIDIFVNK